MKPRLHSCGPGCGWNRWAHGPARAHECSGHPPADMSPHCGPREGWTPLQPSGLLHAGSSLQESLLEAAPAHLSAQTALAFAPAPHEKDRGHTCLCTSKNTQMWPSQTWDCSTPGRCQVDTCSNYTRDTLTGILCRAGGVPSSGGSPQPQRSARKGHSPPHKQGTATAQAPGGRLWETGELLPLPKYLEIPSRTARCQERGRKATLVPRCHLRSDALSPYIHSKYLPQTTQEASRCQTHSDGDEKQAGKEYETVVRKLKTQPQ